MSAVGEILELYASPRGRRDRHPRRYATDKVLVLLHCHLVTALNGCNKSNIVGSFILSSLQLTKNSSEF